MILRPAAGAQRSAQRARALGLEPITAPLFTVRPLAWPLPDPSRFEALILTSANAALEAGDGLTSFRKLPCYAVGETTAEAAKKAGLRNPRIGPGDGVALVRIMAREGIASAVHLCGFEHKPLGGHGVAITSIPVYAAEPADALPEPAVDALRESALVLLHSPRAAATFARFVTERRSHVRLAVISASAAEAAGSGWAQLAVASRPRDEALLELAAKLCQTGDDTGRSASE